MEKENLFENNKFIKIHNIRPNLIRLHKSVFQKADPFLFVSNDTLFCFFEEKNRFNNGILKVCYTNNLKKWKYGSLDLKNYHECHLSYPFIFKDDKNIYLLPETGSLDKIVLFKCDKFPLIWSEYKILLNGKYVDSHILKHESIYYLFTTRKVLMENNKYEYQLELFYSNNLNNTFEKHPSSPINIGKKHSRSGGKIIKYGDKLYRIAQDCEDSYGKEINAFEISLLNIHNYNEYLVEINIISNIFKNKEGGHHLSIEIFKEQNLVAVDFNKHDFWIQNFIYKINL